MFPLALFLVLAVPGVASAAPGCATGDAQRAGTTLYGGGTELVKTERVAGLRTALVLEPRVYPGTRHRLIATDAGWCDATTAFNDAWTGAKGAEMAAAYARLAAAPYFDDVTIRDARSLANVHTLTTHARTNGVVATWTITTDAAGIKTATWTATGFAQKPFVAQIEGLTALPEATETYDRIAGVLRARRGLPTTATTRAAEDDPGVGVRHTGSDGFPIDVHYGDAPTAPQLGTDTGVYDVDFIRITQRAIAENYEEFLDWGLQRGWDPDDGGFVAINDALSAYCLACVLIANDFNIHVNSHANDALELLGYSYPGTDVETVWKDILGHEMFHNFQNRYVRPGPVTEVLTRDTVGAYYSEGTARMQESLHRYNAISHQPHSLIYAQDGNGCNGFDDTGDMDESMAAGLFTGGQSYSTCYFWLPFYAANGWRGLKDLVTRGMPAAKAEDDPFVEGMSGVTAASGDSALENLQLFARSALVNEPKRWGAILGGPTFDWSAHLERWAPAILRPGGEHTRDLDAGGMMANAIEDTVRVDVDAPKEVRLFTVREDGRRTRVQGYQPGRRISAPRGQERAWIVAARPEAGTGSVTLTAR